MKVLKDIIDKSYSFDLLPKSIRKRRLRLSIVVLHTTTEDSSSPVQEWIYKNYGLKRYEKCSKILFKKAYLEEYKNINIIENPLILTTGSLADLDKEENYPWIKEFRNSFLKKVLKYKIPILAPCFGLAQLAKLYANDDENAFPKGNHILNRLEIKFDRRHPLFCGIKRLTGYCHHNGTINKKIINRNKEDIKIYAYTKYHDRYLPSVVTFGGSPFIIGTQFHREILDDESLYFYNKKSSYYIHDIFNMADNALWCTSRRRWPGYQAAKM